MAARVASAYQAHRNVAALFVLLLLACSESQPTAPTGAPGLTPPLFQAVGGAAREIAPDAHTVLLDHFNGTTLGTVFGPWSYATGLPGLGDAATLGVGVFAIYRFPAWYSYCCGSDAATQGTIEMWVKPEVRGEGILDFNWNYTTSRPTAGHVIYLTGPNDSYNDGAFFYQTWNFERCCLTSYLIGNTIIPLGEWTHLALSWSPTVSKLYVNGVVDQSVPENVYPAIGSTVNAYLNQWGGPRAYQGLVDELHVSRIQRTDGEIAEHARRTPTVLGVAIDIKPGSTPNPINSTSNGTTPVAILSNAGFDAPARVDRASLSFGRTGNEQSLAFCAGGGDDVNGDGLVDLVCHFKTQRTGFQSGDTEGILRGLTLDATLIEGRDAVRIVR